MKESDFFNTGIIECKQGTAVFINDNYTFSFLNALSKKPDVYDRSNAFTLSLPADGFLKGTTHDGHDIAIYCGSSEEFGTKEIPSYYRIRASTYLVQCGNYCTSCDWSHFEAIEFRGGTLNDIFLTSSTPSSKNIQSADGLYSYSGNIDTPFGKIKVIIGKMSHEHRGPGEYSFSNRTGYIEFVFSRSITLKEIFPHIENATKFVAFLTGHKNICFDEIYLMKHHEPHSLPLEDVQIFQEPPPHPVQKSSWNNICVDEIHDSIFPLFELIYSDIPNNPFCFIDFLPSVPQDVGRMSTDIIHNIVTCLECELSRIKTICSPSDGKNATYLAESDRLFSLVSELKETVRSYEKENGSFSKKTHDMLMGTLKHLSLADADKIYLVYEKYSDILHSLFLDSSSIPNREDIENLIIHRNRTTHGTQQILDNRLSETAFYLIGLIYCMILHSVGVDDSQLKNSAKNISYQNKEV